MGGALPDHKRAGSNREFSMRHHVRQSLFVFAASASAALVLASCAQDHSWGTAWDAVAQQPGAKVVAGTNSTGEQTRDIKLPNGIHIIQVRSPDGTVQTTDVDESGHGAVMCAWGLYAYAREELGLCPSSKGDTHLKVALDDAMSRIDRFIDANSLVPHNVDREESIRRHLRSTTRQFFKEHYLTLPGSELESRCVADLRTLRMQGAEGLNDQVTKLLSAPRLPAEFPCL